MKKMIVTFIMNVDVEGNLRLKNSIYVTRTHINFIKMQSNSMQILPN